MLPPNFMVIGLLIGKLHGGGGKGGLPDSESPAIGINEINWYLSELLDYVHQTNQTKIRK